MHALLTQRLAATAAAAALSAARAAGPSTGAWTLAAAFSTSPASAAAAKKAVPMKKKKVAIKKKSTSSGPRGEGGKKRGGSEGGASPLRASEWSSPKADMSNLDVLRAGEAASQVGTVVAYDSPTLEALQHFGTPKQLGLALARQPRPRTLIRPHSLALFKELDAGAENASAARTSVLNGPRGAGASTLLMHAVSYALAQKWLVLYLPSLHSFINSSSAYVYDAAQKTYLQPVAAQAVLCAFGAVNASQLKQLRLDEEVLSTARTLAKAISSSAASAFSEGQNAHALTQAGAAETAQPQLRQLVLEVILQTLAKQTSFPVLVAMDDFQALYATSRYRNPDYRQLESYDLAVPRALLQLVRSRSAQGEAGSTSAGAAPSQAWKLRRGAVLGALSEEYKPLSYPAVAKELYTALGLAGTDVAANPFASLNRVHLKHVQESNLLVRNVMSRNLDSDASMGEALQKDEAAALFNCVNRERGIFSPPNDELFLSKLVESGGNLGLFERGLQRTLI